MASSCSTSVLKLWDPKTMIEHFSLKLDAKVNEMMFSKSSDKLVLFTGANNTTHAMVFDIKK